MAQHNNEVVENWHGANQFIAFGNEGKWPILGHDELELRAFALHLVQNSMIYINTLMLQHLLNQNLWSQRREKQIFSGMHNGFSWM
ncbi:MAG: Tn3 family transposase [Chloroflexi bacterium]|nr:Tn3 family transposase [Chloroflexota bacterium]